MSAAQFNTKQALRFWHTVMDALVVDKEKDLTFRQMAVLLEVYLEMPPHTVRDLAKKLDVTKPVVTRALDTMGEMGLVTRKRDPADRRNVLIQRTVEGSQYVEELGDLVLRAMSESS